MEAIAKRFEEVSSDARSGYREVPRDRAVAAFGRTFVHEGSWKNPIREVLGVQNPDTMPSFDGRFYADLTEAVGSVARKARDFHSMEVDTCDLLLSSRRARFLLLAGRILKRVRHSPRYIVLSVTLGRRKRASEILDTGFSPKVEQLPAMVRMPNVLRMDAPVFVVDYSRFMRVPVAIREENILDRIIVPTRGGPFHAVVRYRISSIASLLSYDHPDERSTRMDGIRGGVAVFLWREDAERFVRSVIESVEAAMIRSRDVAGLLAAPEAGPRLVEDASRAA